MPKSIARNKLAICKGCEREFRVHWSAQKYCQDCRVPKPPFNPIRSCVDCGQQFHAGNWQQIRCKPCGAVYAIESRRQYSLVHYHTNRDRILARQKERRTEIANESPLLKKGHPPGKPRGQRDCLRCGADFAPNAANQKFCPSCGSVLNVIHSWCSSR